jgi:hypothetical protein
MTDIVDRLRNPMMIVVPFVPLSNTHSGMATATLNVDQAKADMAEAADEIERLRAKIEAISQVAGKASIDGITFAQIKGRSYTSHTYAINLARLDGCAESARDGSRNEINLVIVEKLVPRPDDVGSGLGPDRPEIGRVGILKRKTVTGNGGADTVDKQLPNADGAGLYIDNIGGFQIDWRAVDARAEMIDSSKPVRACPTPRNPNPPSTLWCGESLHE